MRSSPVGECRDKALYPGPLQLAGDTLASTGSRYEDPREIDSAIVMLPIGVMGQTSPPTWSTPISAGRCRNSRVTQRPRVRLGPPHHVGVHSEEKGDVWRCEHCVV